MAEYLIKDTTLFDIANAIRAKTKKTDIILVSNLASEIDSISESFGYKKPVLNASLPSDISCEFDASVTLRVEIETAGTPNTYTYQWYKDGAIIDGATGTTCTISPGKIGSVSVYCVVTNDAGAVTSRTATITGTTTYFFNAGKFNSRLCPNGISIENSNYTYINGSTLHMSNKSDIITVDKINFTKFTTIKATVSKHHNAWIKINIINDSGSVVSTASSHNGAQGSNSTVSLNVSNINTSYYLQITEHSNYAYTDIAHNIDISSIAFT